MSQPLSVGVGWLTDFRRPGLKGLLYRPLRYSYRAPSYFAATMLDAGCSIRFVRFDEDLRIDELDGTAVRITDSVDILYLSSHGEYRNSEYRMALRTEDWLPCVSGFALAGPSVAVFDTCDLIDLADPNWFTPWISNLGPKLRLLLGFASPATVAQSSSKRGRLFAERIAAGAAIGPAWLEAVHATGFPGLDLGVAVGFGDSDRDASRALKKLTMMDLPAARGEHWPCFELEASR